MDTPQLYLWSLWLIIVMHQDKYLGIFERWHSCFQQSQQLSHEDERIAAVSQNIISTIIAFIKICTMLRKHLSFKYILTLENIFKTI